MHPDVLQLRQFYYRTRLGRIAQNAMRMQVLALWPDLPGKTIVGFGFAAPLLRPYLATSARVICLMPAQQGVMPWPAEGPNISVLCREDLWPIETGFADHVVCLHGFDTSDHPAAVAEECARVLAPGGRAIFIVPNRSGLWARRDITPFGYGRPYSLNQLEAHLRHHGFTPERHVSALFSPPSEKRFWLRSANMIEKIGAKVSSLYGGGVIMLEVSRQTYAPTRPGLAERMRRPLQILDGLPSPVGATGRTQFGRGDQKNRSLSKKPDLPAS
jgi:SAM-dependent methyltransferase